MSYQLRNYRHRNPKGGDDKKTNTPFFQPKLTVGQSGDHFEKAADAKASEVTQKSQGQAGADIQQKEIPGLQRLATSKEDEKLGTNDARMEKDKEEPMKAVQKKEAPGKEKEKKGQKAHDPKKEKNKKVAEKKPPPEKDKEKSVQKKETGEKKKKKKGVQKADDPQKKDCQPPNVTQAADPAQKDKDGGGNVQKKDAPGADKSMTSDAVAAEIKKQSGKGSPLPPKVLAEMSKSFGVDLGNVRIHSDMAAVKLCQELQAMAFTHGQDIYFNEGKFNPESPEGKKLLAHELTHVIQQANSIES